mmetsp:Transcript_8100/g.16433  ORF Transcript_8100/g.16433 Transcript_8100/m.16433 type:complete len:98 (+) Transcript_8100:339-632(+)
MPGTRLRASLRSPRSAATAEAVFCLPAFLLKLLETSTGESVARDEARLEKLKRTLAPAVCRVAYMASAFELRQLTAGDNGEEEPEYEARLDIACEAR